MLKFFKSSNLLNEDIICNKGVALEAILLKTVLILIRIN